MLKSRSGIWPLHPAVVRGRGLLRFRQLHIERDILSSRYRPVGKQVKPGGIYLGVGPDQNFSYIVHTKPTLAIITDIRRQNMLEHLWYKALFALSNTRAEYLSLLVSRETPRVNADASLQQILRDVAVFSDHGKALSEKPRFGKEPAYSTSTNSRFRLPTSKRSSMSINILGRELRTSLLLARPQQRAGLSDLFGDAA